MAREFYYLEELDDTTADYLRGVKRAQGEGLAGVYVETTDYGPPFMMIIGLIILVVTFFLVNPPLHDPTNMTMLLTAGVLLGGWLMLAGLRVYIARGRGTNLGSFFYVDPWQLWAVDHSKVERFDLDKVTSASLAESRNKEGVYQNTTVHMRTIAGFDHVTLTKEVGAREIHAAIEFWVQRRAGQPLSPVAAEQLAAAAKAYAFDLKSPPEIAFPAQIPKPQKVRQASSGWLNLLLVTAAGVGLFYLLHPVVIAWRDDAIFDHVRNQSPRELRAYLVDARNTRHREKVQELLAARYAAPIAKLQDGIRQNGDPKLADVADPMGELLKNLTTAAQPIVTVRVREKTPAVNPPDPEVSAKRAARAQTLIVDSLLSVIGPELLAVAQAPEGVPAFIELEYELVPDRDQPTSHFDATLTLRKSPDDEPLFRRTWQTASFRPDQTADSLRELVKSFTGVILPADNDWDVGQVNP